MPLRPFTVEHFATWAKGLTLDTGKPWNLEDFQRRFLRDLWEEDAPLEAWLIVPEGNAKSTLIAGVDLYHLEFQAAASIALAASTRDQAKIIFDQAAGFITRSGLDGFKIQKGHRRILHGASVLQVFAAGVDAGDGIIPSFATIDELHRHKDLDLYRTWGGKLDKRQARMAVISTAGEPGSEFEEARELIRQSATDIEREGCFVRARAPGIVLHEYAVPEDGDTEDLDVVKAANPLKAITVETLKRKRAKPTMTVGHWRRLTCNLPTRSESAAIGEAEWFGAAVDDEIPEGIPIALGMDVGWKDDTTALVPLWIRDRDYRLFGDAVILEPPTDGNHLDPDDIKGALLRLNARNPLTTVVMDMTRAQSEAAFIEKELGATVVDRTQSNAMAELDYESFMDALRAGVLKHTGDPGLTRHALNAIAKPMPSGKSRFDRPHSSRRNKREQRRRVIDALVAAAMVHTTAAAEFDRPEYRTVGWA